MIRVALYILLVGVIAFGAAWLADRPGDIVVDWQGWHVETSLMVAIVAIIAIVIALMVLWTLIRWILHGPSAMSGYFRERRQTRGYKALSRGMIAAGAGDARLARHAAKQADKLVRNEPLTLLLDAQAAQLSGDRKAARSAFEAMIERPDTELLGLRGLMIEAERAGDDETARLCVERAAARAPGLAWAANGLLQQQTRAGDWQAALKTVESQAEHRLIDKKEAKRARAVLMTAQALDLEDNEPERALTLALEANKLAPELVPAAVVAGRLSAAAGNTRQVTRVIEKTWRLSPHPDLAEVYAHARPGNSARDRLKRAKMLLQKMPNNAEGRIGVAIAAMEARDWAEAREALEPLTRSAPSQRICMMMADIAEGKSGDAGKVREWLSRAVRAPRDPAWTADGYVSPDWAPVSPITGRLDAFEWKVPVEALAAPEAEIDETPPVEEPARESPSPLIEVRASEREAPAAAAPTGTEPPDPETPGPESRGPKPAAPASATVHSRAPETPAAEQAKSPGSSTKRTPVEKTAPVETTAPPEKPTPVEPATAGPEMPKPASSVAPAAEPESGDPAATETSEVGPEKPSGPVGEDKSAARASTPVAATGDTGSSDGEREPTGDRSAEDHPDAPAVRFARPPDDPGPMSGEEDGDKPKRRFGLF